VYNNKLYIIDFSDGSIAVYDHNGKKLHTLKHNYDKVEVIEAHKQDTINSIKNDVRFKQYAELLIPRLSFPRYFPAVKYCHIADNKIYLLTYAIVDKKSQFIVLNLKGKLLKKIYFPLANVSFYEPYSYTIYKNKLYQLVDNERAEAWDIHIYDFK
jgi:hypothetical protein